MRYFFTLIGIAMSTTAAVSPQRIALIVPLQHQAMDEISKGFQTTLHKIMPNAEVKVLNAQGDTAVLQALLRQSAGYDLIAPIGSQATRLALANIKEKPILGLATEIPQQERERLKSNSVVTLLDEIPAADTLQFLRSVLPDLKKFAVIYQQNEKIMPEIQSLKTLTQQTGITLHLLQIQTQGDIFTLSRQLPSGIQALLVLKDHMVVNAISVLIQATEKQGILLITSDEGSVQAGADLGFGVREYSIGEEGAALAQEMLTSGKPISAIANHTLKQKFVFVNEKSLSKKKFKLPDHLPYSIVKTGGVS